MTILVVEDDPLLRLTVKTMLQKAGFQTIEAADGIEAYRVVKEIGSNIDLLLTDINMPEMDGLSLAEAVSELHPNIPILLMTGQTSSIPSGYVVLHKPFIRQVLLEAVWKLITTPAISDNPPGPPKNSLFRLELEEHWRTKAQKAKERYEQCSRHLRKMLAEQNQGLTPTPDGTFGVRQALIQESAARKEHMGVVKILNDIIKSDKRGPLPAKRRPMPGASGTNTEESGPQSAT